MKKFNEFRNIRERIDIGETDMSDEFKRKVDRERIDDLMRSPREQGKLFYRLKSISDDIINKTQPYPERVQKLEELAKKTIIDNYGAILDDVELDIKLVNPGEVTQEIDFSKQISKPEKKKMKYKKVDISKMKYKKVDISKEDLKKKVTKAKIVNNIIQGEAKNVKPILNMPEIRDSLKDIYENDFESVFRNLNEIVDLADKADWGTPEEIKSKMMKEVPIGFAGGVEVDWEPKKEEKESDEEKKEKILKNLKDDELKTDENPFEDYDTKPKIKAVGIDFSMLIHEAVKGIYQLIAAYIIDNDPEIAKLVAMNVESFYDEVQDQKYGPFIAAKLRDYINSFEDSDLYENMREMIFGKMILLEDSKFVDLMNSILEDRHDHRNIIENIISEIKEEMDEYERNLRDYESDKALDSEEHIEVDTEDIEDTDDFSKMSKRELEERLDKAIDNDDIETMKKISKYL